MSLALVPKKTSLSGTTELPKIARCLASAGYTNHPEGEGVYLLFIDPSGPSLISKHWTGHDIADDELVASPVRPNSTASYLINRNSQLVICIGSDSAIRMLEYNEDEEEWVDESTKQRHVVHPEGKLTAYFGPDNGLCVIFQGHSGRLVHLNKDFYAVTLAVNPAKGTPLSSTVVNDRRYVFYLSATDGCIHYVAEARPGKWTDEVLSGHSFDRTPQNFIASRDKTLGLLAYVLTEDRTMLRVTNFETSTLGLVDAKGNFTSTKNEDQCCNHAWNGTLTSNLLKSYLSSDHSIIDTPGGDNSVTPLAAACWRGHFEVVQLLIEAGANPNALSPQRRTPLIYLTKRSPPGNRVGIARALLDAGAKVDECYPEDNLDTPLMNALVVVADKDLSQELLKRGASLTAKNAHNQTAKMLVAGTKLEPDFLKWTDKPENEMESRMVEFFVSLIVLVLTYSNNESIRNVFDQVITEVMSRLEEIDDMNK